MKIEKENTMKYTYKAKATSVCPNNKAIIDNYTVKIESNTMIMVESIIAYLTMFRDLEIYQEDLTKEIAKHFKDSKVTLVGVHLDVEITSVEGL